MPISMPDLLYNASLVAAIGGGVGYWLKTWLTKRIDFKFKEMEERSKMVVEIEKHQAIALLEKQNTIYPEILEVVYRLRNACRDVVAIFPLDHAAWKSYRLIRYERQREILSAFDPALFLLKENLYKYRALVDEPVFDMLHRFKRKLQDVSVLVDRLTRPPEPGQETLDEGAYASSIDRLAALSAEADTLYEEITHAIKAALERHLPKPLYGWPIPR